MMMPKLIQPSVVSHSDSVSSLNEPPLTAAVPDHEVHGAGPVQGSACADSDTRRRFRPPFFILLAGGGACGKKSVCNMIMEILARQSKNVAIVKLENFYRELTPESHTLAEQGEYNFDHPDSIDFRLLESMLVELASGRSFPLPSWDFKTHKRIPATSPIAPHDVIILSGTLTLYKKRIRDFASLRVFVDLDSDVRLANQVIRDTEQRYQMDLENVLMQYLKFVKPSFDDFIFPTKKFADVIIPRGAENRVAIELLAKHIGDILTENSLDADGASSSLPGSVSSSKSALGAAAAMAALGETAPESSFFSVNS